MPSLGAIHLGVMYLQCLLFGGPISMSPQGVPVKNVNHVLQGKKSYKNALGKVFYPFVPKFEIVKS